MRNCETPLTHVGRSGKILAVKEKVKRIVVQVATCAKATSDITSGIMRYAAAHREWDIQFRGLHPSNDRLQDFSTWQPDGLIAAERIADNDPIFRVKSLKAATFLFRDQPASFRGKSAEVAADNESIGQIAADFLIRKGLKTFAYVGSLDNEAWSRERWHGFRKRLVDAGFRTLSYVPPKDSGKWESEREHLLEFLAKLSKPCGLFAAFDQRAKHVLDICREEDIAVPEQIQVVGMDNESWICDNTKPTLTSIDADFRAGGYAAAERLDALLDGKSFPRGILRFAPKGLVERGSTADYACCARSVAAAREFIRLHATEPITVDDAVRVSGVSLRLLQDHFRKVLGHGIAAELRNVRLGHACELLKTTDMPLSEITRFCSLGTEANAKNLFRRTYGVTMSDWRLRHR